MDEVIVRVDVARVGNPQCPVLTAGVVEDPVCLEQYLPIFAQHASEGAEEPQRILDPVENAEAEDEVEALLGIGYIERVHASVLDL